MISTSEKYDITGHLTIHKVINGEEELVFDEQNVIVSGFGWSLATLFAHTGSSDITDFQIDRFQVGVSGSLSNQVSSTYELSGPLSSVGEYIGETADSNLYAFESDQIVNSATENNSVFGKIPFSKVTKVNSRSVRYTIFLDEDTCNGIQRSSVDVPLNEIGLFIKNPRGSANDESILGAYRYFSDIYKTSDFGLVFRWTITFG